MAPHKLSAWWCGFVLPQGALGGGQVGYAQQGPHSIAGPRVAGAQGAAGEMCLRAELIFQRRIFITGGRESSTAQPQPFSNQKNDSHQQLCVSYEKVVFCASEFDIGTGVGFVSP